MSGANSPEILSAYESVRSDKDETNWLIISYAAATGNALTLTSTGTGGLPELAEKLDEGQAQYAYVRVEYANDTESKRVKFVLVIWSKWTSRLLPEYERMWVLNETECRGVSIAVVYNFWDKGRQ